MDCYLTRTGGHLPGPAISNDAIHRHLGRIDGEEQVQRQVLAMNGILSRHYAIDECGQSTADVYELARRAIEACVPRTVDGPPITYLAAGTTYAPLSGPGLSSIVHARIADHPRVAGPIEVSSHAGICTSAAAALTSACRAVASGEHAAALAVGVEQASAVLRADRMRPVDDRAAHSDLRHSQWFMSVFLRFMLSDGAGAWLIEQQPAKEGRSWRVDWIESRSMAHACPLCMQLDNATGLLSQDVRILQRYLFPAAEEFARAALARRGESIDSYRCVLPHLSSFFFRRKFERLLAQLSSRPEPSVAYWTNLAIAGNTGAASIYLMLHEFLQTQAVERGDRLLLFVPESGQFNFVLISLTAVDDGP